MIRKLILTGVCICVPFPETQSDEEDETKSSQRRGEYDTITVITDLLSITCGLTSLRLILPHLTSLRLTSYHLTSPHITSLHLTSLHFTPPHLISPHLTSPHLSHNIHGGRLGTTDDFTTSFLRFSLLSTGLWDLTNSRPVHSL